MRRPFRKRKILVITHPKGEVCDVHGDKDCSVKEENIEEGKEEEGMTQKGGLRDPPTKYWSHSEKGVEKYRRQNPGSKLIDKRHNSLPPN